MKIHHPLHKEMSPQLNPTRVAPYFQTELHNCVLLSKGDALPLSTLIEATENFVHLCEVTSHSSNLKRTLA